MNTAEFWELIGFAKGSVEKTTDIPQWLTDHLTNRPTAYIGEYELRFNELFFRAYDAKVWAAASVMMDFCSDDKFMDFRGWLISKGKQVYEEALHDPDTLADVEVDGDYGSPTLFNMSGAGEEAYRAQVGEDRDITDIITLPPHPELANEHLLEMIGKDRAKLREMFPRLSSRFEGPV